MAGVVLRAQLPSVFFETVAVGPVSVPRDIRIEDLFANASRTLTFAVEDENGAQQDMTGWGTPSWRLGFSQGLVGQSAVIQKTPTVISVQLGTNNGLEIQLVPADTDIDPRPYFHELKVIDDTGKEFVVAVGEAPILQSQHAAA